MKYRPAAIARALAICILGGAGIQAYAQNVLEEIIVTARKVEESVQTTPVAVTALSESMLYTAQVLDVGDLAKTTPSLSILEGGTGSSSLLFVAIRGNVQAAPNAAADAAVGTYIDGVYLSRPTGGNVDMFDVQRIEVLRGPQGTLFGRNTTGGAINVVTNQPTGELEGYFRAEVGDYGHARGELVLNLPLSGEELAARIAVRYNERNDGYGEYHGYTDPAGFYWEGLNQDGSAIEKNSYVRAKLRWAPADSDFEATLGFWDSEFEGTGQRTRVVGINTNFTAGPFTVGDIMGLSGFTPAHFLAQQQPFDAYWNADGSSTDPSYAGSRLEKPQSSNETSGFYLDLDADLGDFHLKSISSWHETTSGGTVDLDGMPINLLTFRSIWDQDQWSQEFQLSSSMGDNLDWIAGLYYMEETSKGTSHARQFAVFNDLFAAPAGVPVDAGSPLTAGTNTSNEHSTTGVFFQTNYSFSESLRGTAGLRYTWDKREIDRKPFNVAPSALFPDGVCGLPVEDRDDPNICSEVEDADFDYPAWVLSLDYQVNDNLFVYGKTSGASMAGGWNVRGLRLPAFDPEDVVDVEAGFKADMLDGTMRLNVAVFYMWAEDQQRIVNEFIPETGSITQYVRNAAKTETAGAEFELTWLPWEGMTIAGTLSLLDAEYEEYEILEGITSGDNAGQTVLVDHSTENPVHAPEMSYTVGATQLFDTSFGEIMLHVDYTWVDDTYFSDNVVRPGESAEVQQAMLEEQAFHAIPDYGLVSALVRLRTQDETMEFSLWGKNLADEEYYTGVSNFYSAFGSATWYWGNPRTWGASVTYNW